MPIEYRNITNEAEGINSFDIQQSIGTAVNENTEDTFVNFLQSSTRFIQQIATAYSTLRAGDVEGSLSYVENSEGTSWLPYTVGGTYYPKGWYIWDGVQWVSSQSNVAVALDAAQNTGSLIQGDNISLLTNDSGFTSFDGEYSSLSNTPTLFDGDYNTLSNKPALFDGDYDSLSNSPELAAKGLSAFYSEFTYSGGNLTKIEYWNSASKTTKRYTQDLTYSAGSLSQTTLTNETTSTASTKTLSYDGSGNLINITKS